jgi:isopenicillin-N epimerase
MKFFEENEMDKRTAVCRKIILGQYPEFCELLNTRPLCPVSEEFLGQMCSIPIRTDKPVQLKEILYNDYKIEIPVMQLGNENYLRISFQVYNSLDDLQYLKKTLKKLTKLFK